MKKKLMILIPTCIILIVLAVFLCLGIRLRMKVKPDFEQLKSEIYDTVFVSMYPIDYYEEEDYAYFRGMNLLKCQYILPNSKILKCYMDQIVKSENPVTTIYLGIDPVKTDKEDIIKMAQANPSIAYEIILSHPQIGYWTQLSDVKYQKTIKRYREFAEAVIDIPNVKVYMFSGEEWLICNSHNYEYENCTNPEVSLLIMCSSDYLHAYILKKDNLDDFFGRMEGVIKQYREAPVSYPNGENYDIVFIGDSIIGNCTNSMSIPEIVHELTGATVYNCGVGGKSATTTSMDPLSANMIVDALLTGKISELACEEHLYSEADKFIKREEKENLMFFIHFGLNDYFEGYPLKGEDRFDEKTFMGAYRLMIQKIQTAYPNAKIMICTPNFTVKFDNGQEIRGENAGRLSDYADAILEIAEEMDVEVLDNFYELPITKENNSEFLGDGVHLNERGNFLVGSRIAIRLP